MVLEIVPQFVWYALVGAAIREVWGVWRAYETFLDLRLSWKRILVTGAFAWFFGSIGGLVLSTFGVFALGINLAALFSGILSGNSIAFLAKKLGFAQKLEVPVSDQQLVSDLSPRQANALQAAGKLGRITNRTHQRLNATTRNIAKRDLLKLVAQGKLVKVGRGKGTYYVLRKYGPDMSHENTGHRMAHKRPKTPGIGSAY